MCSLGRMATLWRQSWGWAPLWLSRQLLTPIQRSTVNNNHRFSLLGPHTSTESAAQQFRRHVDIFAPLCSRSARNSRPNSGSLCAKKNVLGDINVKKWRKNDKAVSRGPVWDWCSPAQPQRERRPGKWVGEKKKTNGAAMRCGRDEEELRWLCHCPVITSFYLQQIEKKRKKGGGLQPTASWYYWPRLSETFIWQSGQNCWFFSRHISSKQQDNISFNVSWFGFQAQFNCALTEQKSGDWQD